MKKRITVMFLGSMTLALSVASEAAAASMTLAVPSEPVESITTQVLVSGTTIHEGYGKELIEVNLHPSGGEGCGANSNADKGTLVLSTDHEQAGPYSIEQNLTIEVAGNYLLCAWQEADGEVIARSSLAVSVRRPNLSLSVSAPAVVAVDQDFEATTTAQAEAEREVDLFFLPDTTGACPANSWAASEASGSTYLITDLSVVGGPVSHVTDQDASEPGAHLLCAYFVYERSYTHEAWVEDAASAIVEVTAPPPPCVVPSVASHPALSAVEATLAAQHCVTGTVTDMPSRGVPAGEVISLGRPAGRKLASGARVNVKVSTGPVCVVPPLGRHTLLKPIERRVLAANCKVGKIKRQVRERMPAGTVVRITPKSGTKLASGASVALVVTRRARHKRRGRSSRREDGGAADRSHQP